MNSINSKNKNQLYLPFPNYTNPHSTKPKNTNNVPSKSFSQSFLNHLVDKKYTKNHSQTKDKSSSKLSNSLDTKNKKRSYHDIIYSSKTQKSKLFLSSFDNKFLKETLKNKSNKSHSKHQESLIKSTPIQKKIQSQPKNYLRINQHHKNKSQLFLNQYNNLGNNDLKDGKTFSTSKNQSFKAKVIGHLQNKTKKNQINYSLSERKKTSDKIEQKIKSFYTPNEQSLQKNINFLSNRQQKQENKQRQSQQRKSFSERQKHEEKLKYKYAFRTKKGKNIGNPHKVNQDSILVKQNISKKDLHMIAVADGHGPCGHHVSQFVVKSLSKLFSQEINQIIKYEGKIRQAHDDLIIEGPLILPKIYDKIQNDLSCSQINAVASGCTLVNVILQKEQVLCANVGDSRAIMARQLDKKNWELIYLSEDHKPSNQIQRKRVLKAGGRIHSFKGDKGQNLGPLRVWLPNQNIQGLAMTRSFGDNISKPVGVTHKPEIIRVKIDQKDKFILVASDGVWQFISNQQILQLIAPFYKQKKLQQACDSLLQFAYSKWTQEDDSVVDDISFVLIFLHC